MEVAEPEIDRLLRAAIAQKHVIRFVYRSKLRVVEPHDYGIHKGQVKLFGFQVGGLSSEPLPGWRWTLVNSISDLRLLDEKFPGRRPTPSGKHHHWDQLFIRVAPPEADAPAQRRGRCSLAGRRARFPPPRPARPAAARTRAALSRLCHGASIKTHGTAIGDADWGTLLPESAFQ
jgi:hypothetical protein